MTTTQLETANDAAISRRMRDYQAELADMVASGDITDETANAWAADAQDRLTRDGAWG